MLFKGLRKSSGQNKTPLWGGTVNKQLACLAVTMTGEKESMVRRKRDGTLLPIK